jgi:hypothetical protein
VTIGSNKPPSGPNTALSRLPECRTDAWFMISLPTALIQAVTETLIAYVGSWSRAPSSVPISDADLDRTLDLAALAYRALAASIHQP